MFARLMGLETISPAELRQLMQREPVNVIDVNPRQSWVAARVPDALRLIRQATRRRISRRTRIRFWSFIAATSCAERRPMPLAARRAWDTARSRDVSGNQRVAQRVPACRIRREPRMSPPEICRLGAPRTIAREQPKAIELEPPNINADSPLVLDRLVRAPATGW